MSKIMWGTKVVKIFSLSYYCSSCRCNRITFDKDIGVADYTAGIDFGQRSEVLLNPSTFVVVSDIVGKETEVVAYSCSLQYYMRYVYLI